MHVVAQHTFNGFVKGAKYKAHRTGPAQIRVYVGGKYVRVHIRKFRIVKPADAVTE